MGQKVHPIGIRLGIVGGHQSTWYVNKKKYTDWFHNDLQVREFLRKSLEKASVSRIQINRLPKSAQITLHAARIGVIIGKKGEDIDRIRKEVTRMMGVPVHLNLEEIRKPELDAYLVAENIAQQLVRRVTFRRAMKRSIANAMRLGAKGIKIAVSGRLAGADIARTEWIREGRVPLHTFRADIDYGTAEAKTTYGIIGVKVWIFKGEAIAKTSHHTRLDSHSASEGAH